MQRTGRSIFNFSSGLLLQAITLGIGIVSTPLLLHWLGDERYGAFRAASDWANYLTLLELGISGSLLSFLAKAIGIGERKQILLTLVTGIKAYLKIMLMMILAGIVLGFFITHLVPVQGHLVSELQNGYWLGFLGIFLLPLNPFQLLANASQRSYFINGLIILQSLVITSLTLLLAWKGWGITGQYLAVLVGNIIFQILASWDGLRRYSDVFSVVKDTQAQTPIEKQLWQLNRSSFILRLSGQLSLLADNIIISYFLSPATVVPFFVTQRLASIAQAQVQGIGNSTWAALADLHAKGEIQKFNNKLIELTRLVAVMAITFMIPIMAYNHYFIKLWLGEARFGGDLLTLLATCNGLLLGIFSLWSWCFLATGHQPKLVLISTLSVSVNFPVSIICTHYLGIIGPLLGTFIAFMTVNSWWSPLILKKVYGISVKQIFWAIVKPLSVGIPYGLIAWWIAKNHTPWGWFGLAIEMGVTALIYLCLAWFLVLASEERLEWGNKLRIFVSNKIKS